MVEKPHTLGMVPQRVDTFQAFRIREHDGRMAGAIERLRLEDLSPGEVVIRVSHSGINYKDALAATGAGKILRRHPLNGGIDLAGTVASSVDPAYRSGQLVLVTGCGLSETRDGGYAQYARVPAEAVVPIPSGLDAASAMGIGTAGFAAALAIVRMEANGQAPSTGPVLVTGATGGVGSLAIDMLSAKGYEVIAVSGKPEAADYLRGLGAHEIIDRRSLQLRDVPLESARWGGAIDNVGGPLLAWLLRGTRERGNVAAVGLAATAELSTTVMPFILRGVSLLGIASAASPRALRLAVWERIASDLKPRHLDRIVRRSVTLTELPSAFREYLEGRVIGRTLVRVTGL
jgi:acrylyl-CoA reductase (NADPH)